MTLGRLRPFAWVLGLAVLATAVLATAVLAAACGGQGEPESGTRRSSEGARPTGQEPGDAESGGLSIGFTSTPDPMRAGDNVIEMTVRQPGGSPVTDGTVTAVFSMPAMPSMNMPAMRSDSTLTHLGEGKYRGIGQLSMGGTWNVTLTVSRSGQRIGGRRLSIVAK